MEGWGFKVTVAEQYHSPKPGVGGGLGVGTLKLRAGCKEIGPAINLAMGHEAYLFAGINVAQPYKENCTSTIREGQRTKTTRIHRRTILSIVPQFWFDGASVQLKIYFNYLLHITLGSALLRR